MPQAMENLTSTDSFVVSHEELRLSMRLNVLTGKAWTPESCRNTRENRLQLRPAILIANQHGPENGLTRYGKLFAPAKYGYRPGRCSDHSRGHRHSSLSISGPSSPLARLTSRSRHKPVSKCCRTVWPRSARSSQWFALATVGRDGRGSPAGSRRVWTRSTGRRSTDFPSFGVSQNPGSTSLHPLATLATSDASGVARFLRSLPIRPIVDDLWYGAREPRDAGEERRLKYGGKIGLSAILRPCLREWGQRLLARTCGRCTAGFTWHPGRISGAR